jgi:UDP-N-acetylmuramyl pentapeptide synthase
MPNSITYNPDGYADIAIIGDQTYMTFVNVKNDADDILDRLSQEGRPRLVLIDLSQQGSHSADTNRAAMEMMEVSNYDKIALYGASKILEEITKAIIMAMGKGHKTKIFATRDDALAWLKAPIQGIK